MPTYTWENKRTGEEVQVFRKMSEMDEGPKLSELPESSNATEEDEWERILAPGSGKHLRARGFGIKGHW